MLDARCARRADEGRDIPMLARTHGQPATPTTIGKEFAVFVAPRSSACCARVEAVESLGKFSGATGTFAAHLAADPDADWPALSREFVTSPRPRLEPAHHPDRVARLAGRAVRRDQPRSTASCTTCAPTSGPTSRWATSRRSRRPGATGSSTMPHKINPIRFENAEANLELSSALLDSLAATLVTSRLQRDLTDSTTQRNIGVALGHSLLALDNLARGLGEIADRTATRSPPTSTRNWEVLGEAIQTVIRAEVTAGRSSIADPYALLKELTRGKRVGADELRAFVDGLDIGDEAKARLLRAHPRDLHRRSPTRSSTTCD